MFIRHIWGGSDGCVISHIRGWRSDDGTSPHFKRLRVYPDLLKVANWFLEVC